ncbi:Trichodiene oxygenase [Talaromyces pinophilus]|nr:Trichodiene oxygenase [Talaromyces pinophilus]
MIEMLIPFLQWFLTCTLLYTASLVVYRLKFHHAAHIPGPFLAKLTFLYGWYYDLYLDGQYAFKIKELHKIYGPIIRIDPDTVHINDPDYFEVVHNQKNGRQVKPPHIAEMFGPYPALLGTASHELHRIRRTALNPFFSRKSVMDLVPTIQRPTAILCKRLEHASLTSEMLNLKYVFPAVTLDIINAYCFAREPTTVLEPDFGKKETDNVATLLKVSLLNTHIPWLMRFTYSLPDRVSKILTPAVAKILDFRKELSYQVEAIRNGQDTAYRTATHRTVFHELLDSKLLADELNPARLRDEAFSLVTAGSDTTAHVLRGTTYHISANPTIRQQLFNELKAAIPDPNNLPSLPELEKLPYLSAVIHEGLRLANPVTHRLVRQFPDKAFEYQGYMLPPNTTIGMSPNLVHFNEDKFPEPHVFKPERWLGPDAARLQRYLISFSRGPRGCLGINLARAELFIILATVFRQFEFDVSAVVRSRDIDLSRDFILGAVAVDSPGTLVKVKLAG